MMQGICSGGKLEYFVYVQQVLKVRFMHSNLLKTCALQ